MSDETTTPEGPTIQNLPKGSFKEPEFWIAVAMFVAGCWLIERGQEAIGASLIGVTGFSYNNVRPFLKKAGAKAAPLLLACLMLAGCHQGCVSAEAVSPLLWKVVTRHDRYVEADPTLDEARRQSYLTSGHLLKRVFAEAQEQDVGEPVPDLVETREE